MAKMFGAVLKSGLWTGAGAAMYASVVFALDPYGEFGVEIFQAMDTFLGKAEEGFKP